MSEKTQTIHKKVEDFKQKQIETNKETNTDCHNKHCNIGNKLNIIEEKFIILNDESSESRCKKSRSVKSKTKCSHCNEIFSTKTEMERNI